MSFGQLLGSQLNAHTHRYGPLLQPYHKLKPDQHSVEMPFSEGEDSEIELTTQPLSQDDQLKQIRGMQT